MPENTLLLTSLLVVVLLMFMTPPLFVLWLYLKNRGQTQHSLLRGQYWFLGILRYVIEHVGPEFRFYITDEDNEGKPISREKFVTIMKAAKYLKTLISFGSKRDFSLPGIYLKNSLFPKLESELAVDQSRPLHTRRYLIEKESLFFRSEKMEDITTQPWLLPESQAVVVGSARTNPWALRGVVGMSGMSYGALGKNAISAISQGIGLAGGSWMNTGEGGLSEHHLSGGCDLLMQIGPGLFGVRDEAGVFDIERFRQKAATPEVKGFELKMGQGAKIRGGHVEGAKVNPEIAAIRGVPVWKAIDSPNRFPFITSEKELFDFVERLQREGGKPVGVKMVLGGPDALDGFIEEFVSRGSGPDFITIDGGEGGTGATYKEMADMLGLPAYTAIALADDKLRAAGIRDKIKVIASGKLHLPDEIAKALCLGADLVAIARGFMISVGCIMAHKCHSNDCPVGVATTDAKRERSLFVDEKKYRVMNYLIALRAGLFHMGAACGLASPLGFNRNLLTYTDESLTVATVGADAHKPR